MLPERMIRPSPAASGDPAVARFAINLSWLIKLRWAAVAGQLGTVLIAEAWLEVRLPLTELVALVSLTAITNVLLGVWFSRAIRPAEAERIRRSEPWVGGVMLGDLLTLTALLYVSGGPANPFAVFYLVNLALAAVLLRPAWAWALCVLTVVAFSLLFYDHVSLPALGRSEQLDPIAALLWSRDGASLADPELLRLEGTLASLATAAAILVYFITRLTGELSAREGELADARRQRARAEKLEALATLAGGAAHELSSPLSTIAVAAKELQRELEGEASSPEVLDDLQLIRAEVARCREILDQMSLEAGRSAGERMVLVSIPDLVDEVLASVRDRPRVHAELLGAIRSARVFAPRTALSRAIRAYVVNALDASPADEHVDVEVAPAGDDGVRLRIRDRGRGMDADVVERVGQPFFTTKEPGRGMGLGVFLANSVVERLGGEVAFRSEPGEGTTVDVVLPSAGSGDPAPS